MKYETVSTFGGIMFYLLITFACVVFAFGNDALALNKFSIHGILMQPTDEDAQDYGESNAGWGLQLTVAAPEPVEFLAGVIGFDNVYLLAHTEEMHDHDTGLRLEQRARQRFSRIFLGGEVGPHGYGFFRPHVGLNLALVNYGYAVDIIVPDDHDSENNIEQSLDSEDHWVFGQDVNAGIDLRFKMGFSIDGGARFVSTYNVPESLGRDSKTVQPQYLQIYLAAAYSFSWADLRKSW